MSHSLIPAADRILRAGYDRHSREGRNPPRSLRWTALPRLRGGQASRGQRQPSLVWVDRNTHVRSVGGSCQQGGIRLGELLSPPEQAHGDKETLIGKKRTRAFRERDRIRHGGDNSCGKGADRKIGGPRYLLCYGGVGPTSHREENS